MELLLFNKEAKNAAALPCRNRPEAATIPQKSHPLQAP